MEPQVYRECQKYGHHDDTHEEHVMQCASNRFENPIHIFDYPQRHDQLAKEELDTHPIKIGCVALLLPNRIEIGILRRIIYRLLHILHGVGFIRENSIAHWYYTERKLQDISHVGGEFVA